MVELYVKQPVLSNSSAYWEESLKATETTLWSADTLELVFDNLIYIITGIVLVIIVIAVVIVLRRKKSPPPTPPTPPTSQSSAADTKQE
jgi:TRAP-type mannitol/chloroaromatic compound transport system permease small subunit